MNAEFVPYQPSLDMKELGFDDMCLFWFDGKNQSHTLGYNRNSESWLNGKSCSSPTFSQCFRFFREKLHNTFPSVIQTRSWATLYRIVEWHPSNDSTSISESGYYDTYEEAQLECIKELIEICKKKFWADL